MLRVILVLLIGFACCGCCGALLYSLYRQETAKSESLGGDKSDEKDYMIPEGPLPNGSEHFRDEPPEAAPNDKKTDVAI